MSDHNPYAAPQSHLDAPLPDGQFPMASRLSRLGAALIDGVILWPVYMLGGMLFFRQPDQAALQKIILEKGPDEGMAAALAAATPGPLVQLLLLVIVFAAYAAINWVFLKNGQTIGKKLLGIQVQSLNGGPLPAKDILLKRFLPMQLVGRVPGMIHPMLAMIGGLVVLVDILCIFRSGYNTLHDDIAKSKVVKLPG